VISPADIRTMQTVAQEVFRIRPEIVDATMSELAYQGGMGNFNLEDKTSCRIWSRGGEPVAYAVFWPPSSLDCWQVHPDHPELLEEILDWFASLADPAEPHRLQVRDSAADAEHRIRARGFGLDGMAPFMRLNMRDLDEIEEPQLPAGYTLRTVHDYDGDISGRIAVHQTAWAEFGTRVSAETYPGVMKTWPYRSDLDFMVEDAAGKPVAFALGWYDEANSVGEFEPVGTDPNARRLGLARAVSLFGLHRFRAAGATRAIVACRGDEGHPAPCRLYESVGFREISRQRIYVRTPT
jgi:ribosomal protein S18 acetylase RimI-like enzyme